MQIPYEKQTPRCDSANLEPPRTNFLLPKILEPRQQPDKLADDELLGIWFAASPTSRKLKMFQAYFLHHVARPGGRHPREMLACYERSFGRPVQRKLRAPLFATRTLNNIGPARVTLSRRR